MKFRGGGSILSITEFFFIDKNGFFVCQCVQKWSLIIFTFNVLRVNLFS